VIASDPSAVQNRWEINMARPLRIEYAGAVYHPPSPSFGETGVMARGNQGQVIFYDDHNRLWLYNLPHHEFT
jgi:hypothetical protein